MLDVGAAPRRRAARAHGLRVVLTRDTDASSALEERTAIANDARADLFVSIHANAAERARRAGIETYFLVASRPATSAARAPGRENAVLRRAASAAAAGRTTRFSRCSAT